MGKSIVNTISHPFEETVSQVLSDWKHTKPQILSLVADDGYLYVYVMGQSNQTSGAGTTDWAGYKPDITGVELPDGNGGWVLAQWNVSPLHPVGTSPGIVFCHLLSQKYGVRVRALYNASGSRPISAWTEGGDFDGDQLTNLENTYAALGDNWRPNRIWVMAQGEANNSSNYAAYFPLWDNLRQRMLSEGWLASDHSWFVSEICKMSGGINYAQTVNYTFQQMVSENSKYRFIRMDGEEQSDNLHWVGRSIINLGYKWLRAFEEVYMGIPPKEETDRPSGVTVTVGATTPTTVDLSWTAATPAAGRTIVAYNIYRYSGAIFWKRVDASTLSDTVNFSLSSGETERFQVLAVDDLGQTTTFYDGWPFTDVLIP